ncbi:MAG: right-handed parallel beta-helix repeat-containing protein [Opitutales bacterium]
MVARNVAVGFIGGLETVFVDCKALDATDTGFQLQFGSQLDRCLAGDCAIGFATAESASLVDCVAEGATSVGFTLGSGNTLTRCRALFVSGTTARAFNAFGSGTTLTQCTVVSANCLDAFRIGEGGIVRGCSVSQSTLTSDAFDLDSAAQAIDCSVYETTAARAFTAADEEQAVRFVGCTVAEFEGTDAVFDFDSGVLMKDCTVSLSSVPSGSAIIETGDECRITGCLIHDCSGTFAILGSTGMVLKNCSVIDCTLPSPIQVQAHSLVEACEVLRCSGSVNDFVGIRVTSDSSVINCTVSDGNASQGGASGISVASNTRISGCSVSGLVSASSCVGILANEDCIITECTVSNISGSNATVVDGFLAGEGSTFTHCHASDVAGDGFGGLFFEHVAHCTANRNSGNGFDCISNVSLNHCGAINNGAAGIRTRSAGTACVIDSCRVASSGTNFAYSISGTNHVLTRNVAYGPGQTYLVTGSSGNQVNTTTSATSTNPWINFIF